MKHLIILYGATLLVMVALDLAWLGGVARDFYKSRMGDLMDIQYGWAVAFYLMYVVGILFFASTGQTSWQSVLLYGALFGFFAYATYDLTNMATLKGWSVTLSAADMAWGTFVTGVSATAGFLIARFFE